MAIFKLCSHFSENVVFQKCIKTRTPRKLWLFVCLLVVWIIFFTLHIRTKTWPKITFKSLLHVFFFLIFSPKLYIILQILQNTVKLKSMGMQKISDKMYFNINANRQKKYTLKLGIWHYYHCTTGIWHYYHCTTGITAPRPSNSLKNNHGDHMCQVMQKRVLCHMRTTKAQISLRIRAIWSAPLFAA